MKPREQIATEAAEKVIGLIEWKGDCFLGTLNGATTTKAMDEARALDWQANERACVADAVLAALDEALAPPELSPVEATRLAKIRQSASHWEVAIGGDPSGPCMVTDLLAHVDHLERLCAFLMGEPEGEAAGELLRAEYGRGFCAGAAAQKERSADEVLDAYVEGDGWNAGLCRRIAKIVRSAPLATPPAP